MTSLTLNSADAAARLRRPVAVLAVAARVVEWVTVALAGVVLAGMVGLFAYEVAARYFFDSPTGYANQYGAYAMPVMAFLAASYALRHDAHVRVDWFVDKLSDRTRRVVYLAGDVLGFGLLSWCVWLSVEFAQRTAEAGTRTYSTATEAFPEWIPQTALAVGFGSLLLTQASLILEQVAGWREDRHD
jgi:TRAP-type C4-dicarboxylate transport system permease small subunit